MLSRASWPQWLFLAIPARTAAWTLRRREIAMTVLKSAIDQADCLPDSLDFRLVHRHAVSPSSDIPRSGSADPAANARSAFEQLHSPADPARIRLTLMRASEWPPTHQHKAGAGWQHAGDEKADSLLKRAFTGQQSSNLAKIRTMAKRIAPKARSIGRAVPDARLRFANCFAKGKVGRPQALLAFSSWADCSCATSFRSCETWLSS